MIAQRNGRTREWGGATARTSLPPLPGPEVFVRPAGSFYRSSLEIGQAILTVQKYRAVEDCAAKIGTPHRTIHQHPIGQVGVVEAGEIQTASTQLNLGDTGSAEIDSIKLQVTQVKPYFLQSLSGTAARTQKTSMIEELLQEPPWNPPICSFACANGDLLATT